MILTPSDCAVVNRYRVKLFTVTVDGVRGPSTPFWEIVILFVDELRRYDVATKLPASSFVVMLNVLVATPNVLEPVLIAVALRMSRVIRSKSETAAVFKFRLARIVDHERVKRTTQFIITVKNIERNPM
jgi:hypothetical protein